MPISDGAYALNRPSETEGVRPQSVDWRNQNATINAALSTVLAQAMAHATTAAQDAADAAAQAAQVNLSSYLKRAEYATMLAELDPDTLVRTDDPRLQADAATIIPRVEDAEDMAQRALDLATSTTAPTDDQVATLAATEGTATRTALVGEFVTAPRAAHSANLAEPRFRGDNTSLRLENAMATLAAEGGGVLNISDDLTITTPVTWDISTVALDFNGRTIDATAIKNSPAITITNSASTPSTWNQRYMRDFRLVGPGESNLGSTGLRFWAPVGFPSPRDVVIEGAAIERFHTGESYGRNAYLLRHVGVHYQMNRRHIWIEPENNGENDRYGENISWIGCTFANQNHAESTAFLMEWPATDLHCYACSFDFIRKIADVKAGQLFLTSSHVELRDVMPVPIITTGEGSAFVSVNGGRFQHNNPGAPRNPEYYFEAQNPYQAGGIHISDVYMQNIWAQSGFLCKGPGMFKTSQLSFPSGDDGSGFAQGTLLTSRTQNMLFDPGFTNSTHVDVAISDGTGITSRTESDQLSLTNAAGRLRVRKKTGPGAAATIRVSVPATPRRWYSTAFTLAAFTTDSGGAPGTLVHNERFIAARGTNQYGIPSSLRSSGRPPVSWDVSTLVGQTKAFHAIFNPDIPHPWQRQAPHWANYYEVSMSFAALEPGLYDLGELVITECG